MNILLIGNGFDLAHGLPTKYTDFLDWVVGEYKYYYHLKENNSDIIQGIQGLKLDIPENIKEGIVINDRIEHQIELWECIDDNIWFEYFFRLQRRNNKTWIDFESEISNVIKSIDADMQEDIDNHVTQLSNWYLNKYFVDSKLDWGNDKINYLKFYELRDKLLDDLNRLIRAFEIYLCEYVDNMTILKKSPDIEKLEIHYVISFNYTQTYSKIYKLIRFVDDNSEEKYDYIHGKACIDNSIETDNMVLGIDEYLPEERKNKEIEFIAFKKFYQRIYKGTGCIYKNWADEIAESKYKASINLTQDLREHFPKQIPLKEFKCGSRHNLYIFGHSLDVTDGDVLRDLILNDNVKTTIFYNRTKDKEGKFDNGRKNLGEKIANLVKVIGQDELIRRTGGSTKTIEFKLQQDMEDITE